MHSFFKDKNVKSLDEKAKPTIGGLLSLSSS